MRGTEKQIAWATEITENVVAILEAFAAEMEKTAPNTEIKTANLNAIRARIDALKNAEYAGDVINLFKSIKRTGDLRSDIPQVMAIYKVVLASTPGEKKILCK